MIINTLQFLKSLPHRQTWSLAWPMILSNISVPLMGLADTAMLGHLDNSVFLGSVAIGSNVITLFYWVFSFLRMGTTSVCGRASAAGRHHDAIAHLSTHSLIALLLGSALIVLQSLLIPQALALIAPDGDLLAIAQAYCEIRIFSAPAVLLTFVAMGWLIAQKKTQWILGITIAANALNIALDYVLIIHWNLQAQGAAVATLIAEYFACFCSVAVIGFSLRKQPWPAKLWQQWRTLKHTFALNLDLFVRTLSLLLVINFFNAQSAMFGQNILAANAILLQCALFASFFLDGYAMAAESMTARAIGRRHMPSFHQATAVCAFSGVVIALLLSLVFVGAGDWIIRGLTDIAPVAEAVRHYWFWVALMPLVSAASYIFDGVFTGAGQVRIMRNTMILCVLFGFFLPWYLLRPYDNHGLWLAFILLNSSRGLSLAWYYFRLSQRRIWAGVTSTNAG